MKNILRTLVLISAVIFAPLALAGHGSRHGSSHGSFRLTHVDDMTGWYIGGGLGFGLSNWNNLESGTPGGVAITRVGKHDDFVARAYVGYNFNRTFAEEFGYTLLPYSVTFKEVANNALVADSEAQNWAIDLSTRVGAPIPLFHDVTAFFRLGINYMKTVMKNQDSTLPSPLIGGAKMVRNFNVTYGSGLEYAYNRKVRVRLEWQRFNGKARVFTSHYQPYMDAFTLGISLKLPENLIVL